VVVVVAANLGVALSGGEDGAVGTLVEDILTCSPTAPPTSQRFGKLVNILEPATGMAIGAYLGSICSLELARKGRLGAGNS
jgi:hypothetical protein